MTWLSQLSVAIPLAALCVLISGFCSGSEVALFSLRRVDREQLARSESALDRRILKLLERPRRLIATVLIGNEAFNSFLAVLALIVVSNLVDVSSLWAQAGIALGVSLPLIVLVAEVTSKTLAAKAPLTWARGAVLPLSAFAVVVTPLRLVVNFIAELLLRPLGDAARTRPARDLSEQEFKSLVDAGSAQGQVDARERRLIHRVFEFSDKNVGQVMTPRDRIFAMSYDLPMQRLVREIAARGFSRVPIYQKSLDNVRGIVNAKDLVNIAAGQAPTRPLNELLHEPLFVPRTTPVKRLFLTFKQKKVHMAIVVSEYGKVLGLVTMDDLLAQIFGVIRDERAALQASNPNIKLPRARTPGGPAASPGTDTGPVPKELASIDSGPVPKELAGTESGPVPKEVTGVESGPVQEHGTNGSDVRDQVLDPPPAHRALFPEDEVTPPAVDVEELRAQEKRR
jgi:CBS domain containing-hemolysin-like protein